MDALILFSHGSLLCGSGQALVKHADELRFTGNWSLVEIGYLNYSEPAFQDTVDLCARAGATHCVVAPYFLIPGYFVSKSLPDAIQTAQLRHPRMQFTVAEAIGFDEELADTILDCAAHPLASEHWRDDLFAATSYCRANPECPLFGTYQCPQTHQSSAD